VWLQEKEVQKVKAEGNLSFPQARQIVVQRNTLPISGLTSASQTRSVASVVKQGIPTSRLSVCSVHTQTELTWPNCQESPTTVPPISNLQASQASNTEQPVPSTSSAKSPNHGSNSQSKGKGKHKAPKIKHPPRLSDNPVTMHNRYGALDAEDSMESETDTGIT